MHQQPNTREQTICRNCENLFTGNYCNNCGEKVYNEHDKSIAHFAHEAFHFLTHLDGRFIKSVQLIFSKPGFLSLEVTSGVRRKYFPPLNLFLIAVILYLLFPMLQGLNMPLYQHLHQPYSFLIKPLVRYKLADFGSEVEFATAYNSLSPKFAKVLLLLVLPLSAFALLLLFQRKRKYFFDHLMLAAEYNTTFLLFTFFAVPLLYRLMNFVLKFFSDTRADLNDNVTLPAYLLFFGVYGYYSFRRFYSENKGRSLFKSIIFLMLHAIIVYVIYKLVLVTVVLLFI